MAAQCGTRTAVHPSLSTVSTSIAQIERDYTCPANILRVLCAASGSCTIVTAEKSVRLIGASMVLLIGDITYRLTQPTGDFILTRMDIALESGSCYDFDMDKLKDAFPEIIRLYQQPRACIVFYDNYAFVMSTLQNIHTFSLSEQPERGIQITLTLCFLLAAISTSVWDENLPLARNSKHVRAALLYIHENYMCNISTADIAAAAGVHIGHLHRIFLAETGCRPGEYLINLRISKAKSLLMRTDMPTTSIAHRVGVSTLQYFSRLFKQQVGVTPQAFRKSYNLTCPYENRESYSYEDYSHTHPDAKGGVSV